MQIIASKVAITKPISFLFIVNPPGRETSSSTLIIHKGEKKYLLSQ